jgi:adapter protein MecA 1/2
MKLSELAYGTDKARRLFQEMMKQAQLQYGFETDNTPLMIEAIPINTDSIILIITKVEDPEELDTRFSRFAPFRRGSNTTTLELDGADDIIDIFRKLRDAAQNAVGQANADKKSRQDSRRKEVPEIHVVREYDFTSLEDVIEAAHSLDGFYEGENALYKGELEGYRLIVQQSDCSPEKFNKVCNILSEYGTGRKCSQAGQAYLAEHGDLILEDALKNLARV